MSTLPPPSPTAPGGAQPALAGSAARPGGDGPSSPDAPAATAGSASEDRKLISSDFETFLTMLTTQVENQDPLNPMDSTEFAVQLATFSGVEQQVKTNALLGDMAASGLARIGDWVGMEARAAAPAVFDGAPVALQTAPAPDAERVELVVRDDAGNVRERFDIARDGGAVEWAGQRADGTPFAPGVYDFEVVSYTEAGEVADRSVPEAYSRVSEVRLGEDGPEVLLSSGATVPASDVTGIRAP